MQLQVFRSDGGSYHQGDARQVRAMLQKLDPRKIFSSGPIVIGVLNPFTVLNPDEVCWIDVISEQKTLFVPSPGVESLQRLADRAEFESILSSQWMRWIGSHPQNREKLLEALLEVSFRCGRQLFLHLRGKDAGLSPADEIFRETALRATFEPNGTVYINPKCITRVRVYHSNLSANLPEGLWFAEADDI